MEARFPRGLPFLPILDGVWLRLILAVMVLIASASLLTGTAATLNSTTVNPGSTFEAGDLILSDQDGVAKPCISHGPAVSCDALFPGNLEPGMVDRTTVTLTNLGTLPVGKLLLWSSGCTGQLCPHTWLTIHDDNHDACVYPVQAAGACPAESHGTYADFAAAFNQGSPASLSTDHLGGGDAFTLTAEIDPALTNELQNQAAQLDFTWEITQ